MAHIHLEDGSFSLLWVVTWWLLTLLVIGICLFLVRKRGKEKGKTVTIAAFCTAAAFAIFQISIPVFGGIHLNLTPLIGILTGPFLGSLVVLILNLLSAAIGHGGFGMAGANILVNVIEVIIAYLAYRSMKNLVHGGFARAGIATFVALFAGNAAMIGIILVSGIQGVSQSPAQVMYGLSLLAAINMGVAVIEAIITGFVVGYLEKVRPDLLGGIRGKT
ncbi:MAG TPA: energy-coupling factor ABC transporter permease [Methanoregulaceae archaeon]|nr:energy-coupling factor ABC transporter permease [Methanoregulaceae archaeon]HPD76230.1 energy-coupling factor ABC transporter permease [Methanoregulaceae archaeon]HRY75438.1 energy-coupling factor ABC transporter permease [Methanoregulaceae archaeon]